MRCRLCLLVPPERIGDTDSLTEFSRGFAAALSAGDVASVLIHNGGDEQRLRAAARELRPLAHAAGAALLLEDRFDLVGELGCDGVQVEARPEALRSARRSLGVDQVVGAACGGSRHAAMVAGELEADYVCFDAREVETLAWWAELMEVPCVAAGGITLETAGELIEAGVDFLAVGRAVWRHGDGPAAAVAAFNRLIDSCS